MQTSLGGYNVLIMEADDQAHYVGSVKERYALAMQEIMHPLLLRWLTASLVESVLLC